ncbi:beta-lactamase family protein [Streptosporangiaceae bacterium NEAU-GS5]|nr:beta-lactamase family protein [Streptosporangiaceae bacterium NEAU-GS5]
MHQVPVNGTTDPAFAAVADVFRDLLNTGQETGAALAAFVDGRPVVDLWGGWADSARTRPWTRDTLVTTFSVCKPIAALALLRRVADGRVDLDAPVTRYWPEFGFGGKASATVRHALAHQAGVPVVAEPLPAEAAFDWDRFAAAIAATPAEWEPGTAHGEHAVTYGHVVGTILRRAGDPGGTVGQVIRDEIAGPLDLDVHIGLPASDLARVAELEYGADDWPASVAGAYGSLWARALANPSGLLTLEVLNGTGWRTAEIPAINGHATARGLAGLYAALLAGEPRLLPSAVLDEALKPQAVGVDRLLDQEATWTLGWRREGGFVGLGGIGGSSAGMDLDRGYALAYMTRRLAGHDRSDACYDALEACL